MPRESEKWIGEGKHGGERYERYARSHEVDNKGKRCVKRKKRED